MAMLLQSNRRRNMLQSIGQLGQGITQFEEARQKNIKQEKLKGLGEQLSKASETFMLDPEDEANIALMAKVGAQFKRAQGENVIESDLYHKYKQQAIDLKTRETGLESSRLGLKQQKELFPIEKEKLQAGLDLTKTQTEKTKFGLKKDQELFPLEKQQMEAGIESTKAGIDRTKAETKRTELQSALDLKESLEKKMEKSGVDIPGFERLEGVNVTKDSIKQVKKVAPDILTFTRQLESLISDFNEAGKSPKIAGAKAAELQSKLRELQLIYKNESFAALGVLAGPDMQIIEDVLPNISGLKAAALSQVIGDTITPRLEGVLKRATAKGDDIFRINGFKRTDAPLNTKPKDLQGEDKEAFDWAQSNPNDPRAKAILERLGL